MWVGCFSLNRQVDVDAEVCTKGAQWTDVGLVMGLVRKGKDEGVPEEAVGGHAPCTGKGGQGRALCSKMLSTWRGLVVGFSGVKNTGSAGLTTFPLAFGGRFLHLAWDGT